MELSEIIKLTISIFTACMSIFLFISYTISRIKKHSLIKISPEPRSNNRIDTMTMRTAEMAVNAKREETNTEEKTTDNILKVRQSVQSRFKILNEDFLSGNSGNNLPRLMFK